MAKRKDAVEKTNTKKPKQTKKQAPIKKKIKENGIMANNLKNSKVRSPVSKKGKKSSDGKTSKYFQPDNPEEMSDHSEEVSLVFIKASSPAKQVKEEEAESDEDEDWEEVEEMAEIDSTELEVPSKPVEIEIETPDMARKREKKEKKKAELETYLRRMTNRFNKELLEETHKVHLLCLLASGLYRNRLCCDPDLMAIALSILPNHFTTVETTRINVGFLEGLLKWFQMTFTLNPALMEEKEVELSTVLEKRIGCLSARDHEEMTFLLLLVLRSLRLFCRLVLSLQPLSFKPPPASKNKTTPSKSPSTKNQKPSPNPKISTGSKRPSAETTSVKKEERGGKRRKKKGGEKEALSGQKPKNSRRRSIASKVFYKEVSSEEEDAEESGEEFQPTNEDDSEDSDFEDKKICRMLKGKEKSRTPLNSGEVKEEDISGKEEEEEEEKVVKRRRSTRKEGTGANEWLEVYLESTGRWVCVDVDQGVGQPLLCSDQATQPVTYVVGVDDEGYLKDLSSRYDPTWLTSSRRRRIDSEWWEETVELYKSPDAHRGWKEDQEMQAKLLDKPLPTSIAEFKNHPLYALKRHLLKYEALYPQTAAILGYCRGEPVYSR